MESKTSRTAPETVKIPPCFVSWMRLARSSPRFGPVLRPVLYRMAEGPGGERILRFTPAKPEEYEGLHKIPPVALRNTGHGSRPDPCTKCPSTGLYRRIPSCDLSRSSRENGTCGVSVANCDIPGKPVRCRLHPSIALGTSRCSGCAGPEADRLAFEPYRDPGRHAGLLHGDAVEIRRRGHSLL